MNSNSFSIANFKSFGATISNVNIRPITLVFGPNSSGKSSVIQGLILLSDLTNKSTKNSKYKNYELKNFINNKSQNLFLGLASNLGQHDSLEVGINIIFIVDKDDLIEDRISAVQLRINDDIISHFSYFEDDVMHATMFKIDHPIFDSIIRKYAESACINYDNIAGYIDFKVFIQDFIDVMIECKYIYLEKKSHKIEIYSVCEDTSSIVTLLSQKFGNEIVGQAIHLIGENKLNSLLNFINNNLITNYTKIVNKYYSKMSDTLSRVYHIPPLREIPPKHFDPMVDTDSIWSNLVSKKKPLSNKINAWLGSDKMQSKYQIYTREFIEINKTRNSANSLLSFLLTTEEISDYWPQKYKKIRKEYESLNLLDYIKSHEDLELSILSDNNFNQSSHNLLVDLSNMLSQIDLKNHYNDITEFEKSHPDSYLAKKLAARIKNIPIKNIDGDSSIENAVIRNLAINKYFYPQIWMHFLVRKINDDEKIQKCFYDAENAVDEISYSGLKRNFEIGLYDKTNDCDVTLNDVGVGISQVLPVLLSAYGCEKSIVCVEQPEIHIHPALQSDLADIFIESAMGDNQNSFLLETHSEHLMLRLLRRIRETTQSDFSDWPEELKKACPNGIRPEDVAVIYVQPGEDGAQVQNLRINEHGEFIDEWPQGFFEERIREIF
jgi:predicted ATPase